MNGRESLRDVGGHTNRNILGSLNARLNVRCMVAKEVVVVVVVITIIGC